MANDFTTLSNDELLSILEDSVEDVNIIILNDDFQSQNLNSDCVISSDENDPVIEDEQTCPTNDHQFEIKNLISNEQSTSTASENGQTKLLFPSESTETSDNVSVVDGEEVNGNEQPILLQPTELIQTSDDDSVVDSDNEYLNDPEMIDTITHVEGGRKRKRVNKKEVSKKLRHSSAGKNWKIACKHGPDSKICEVRKLLKSEIDLFFDNLYSNSEKIEQDKYLLNFVDVKKPDRIRRLPDEKLKNPHWKKENDRLTMSYFILSNDGSKRKVCSQSFESISCIKRRRLNLISRQFFNTKNLPKENRGGKRVFVDPSISESIISHIKTFKCNKSHHVRADTGRSYLSSELSVKKMWRLWKKQQTTNKLPIIASYSKYYSIFVNSFNLAFGHPRQDVCSFCTEYNNKISSEKDNEKKEDLQTSVNLHKRKAKAFFNLLKQKDPGVVTVSFDMMQNQPLPKLNTTDVFYSRQVWIYILNFVICSEDDEGPNNSFIYTWNETEGGRGPNEVCSILDDFLKLIENRYKSTDPPPHTLRLFSDSCSAQNKNQFIIGLLLNFAQRSTVFKDIFHFYPVRGHSYLPSDRVFGRIEKIIRKKREILSPSQYHRIMSQHATVKIYGTDFNFFNYKQTLKPILRSPLPFKTTQQKMISYKHSSKTSVGVSSSYTGLPVSVTILKKNKSIAVLDSKLTSIPKENHVKIAKQKDVKNLMRFFTVPEDAKEFYENVLCSSRDEEEEEIEYNPDSDSEIIL